MDEATDTEDTEDTERQEIREHLTMLLPEYPSLSLDELERIFYETYKRCEREDAKREGPSA